MVSLSFTFQSSQKPSTAQQSWDSFLVFRRYESLIMLMLYGLYVVAML